MHAVTVNTLEHMGMQVDQTRRDDLPRDLMDASGLFTGDRQKCSGVETRNAARSDQGEPGLGNDSSSKSFQVWQRVCTSRDHGQTLAHHVV